MNRKLTIVSLLILFFIDSTYAQFLSEKLNGYVPVTICHANDSTEKVSIPPPQEFLLKSGEEKKSEINVSYSLFPSDARAAFEYAVGIWETLIESDVPIKIQANWRTMDGSTLGSAAPADYVTNFKNIPYKNRYYPLALAEKFAGEQINPSSSADITCTFNRDIDWYFKTDQKTPSQLYDFVTVVLHEIAHGLGFTGFFTIRSNLGLYEYIPNSNDGFAAAFDLMVVNNSNQYLVDTSIFDVPSNKLYTALTSSLYSRSPSAAFENDGIIPRLYAPDKWDGGSSVYHLNDETYPPWTGNSLMTHAISKGESVHDPGPLTMGILDDIGWKYLIINLEEPKDIEQVEPIVFNVIVNSDNEIDSTSLFVVYSKDSPDNFTNSVPLVYNSESGFFTASILPEDNTEYFYYISAKDIKNSSYRLPTEAPNEYFTVAVGADLEKPVITHTPVPYFITTEKEIPVTAFVEDNLGVDSVYIEYLINNIPQQPFRLYADSANRYKAIFPISINELNDNDIIRYRVLAVDLSQNHNIGVSPLESLYSFKVEKISDPVTQYSNTFNGATTDFVLFDFDVYREDNFDDGALNSPHPYPSPNQNNKEFNFTALLKRPIILQQDAYIRYDEVVLVEPGDDPFYLDTDFWDYVIVEGSKDAGKTWLPLINGYDSRDNSQWLISYNKDINQITQNSQTLGLPDWYVNRQFNILQTGNFVAGDTILIRFRLFSDPYANGWGWCIDNLYIQTLVSAPVTILSPGNVQIYPNPFENLVSVSILPKKPINIVEIDVYNIYGQKIVAKQYNEIVGELSENIDMSRHPAGIYLFNIKENGISVLSKKVVKQ